MGNIDAESKKYMSDSAHFADAFNYLIYDGKPVIDPKNLSPLDTTEIVIPYGNEAREPEQKYRDVLKLWQAMTDGEGIYAVLGSEIQAKVHYAMPVKDMLYDSMHYAKQVEEAKRSYRNQNDKKEIVRLTSEEFLKFKTDFGKVLQYIKYSQDKEKLYQITHEGDRFRDIDKESADLINVVTRSELRYEVKGGRVDMCTAIDEMRKESRNEGLDEGWKEGRKEGRIEGVLETLASLVKDGVLTIAEAAKRADLTPAEFQAKISDMK